MSQLTKRALAGALKTLLEKSTLDKITVKEISEHCGVNRQTFYYHFQDVYALLEWIFTTEVEKVISDNRTYETWQEGFLQVFKYVQLNQAFVINTFRSVGRDYLERYLYNEVYELLINVVNEQAVNIRVQEKDKRFIADFYKYAFVGMMIEWIRTNMKENPEEIIDRLSKLIEGDIPKALFKYRY